MELRHSAPQHLTRPHDLITHAKEPAPVSPMASLLFLKVLGYFSSCCDKKRNGELGGTSKGDLTKFKQSKQKHRVGELIWSCKGISQTLDYCRQPNQELHVRMRTQEGKKNRSTSSCARHEGFLCWIGCVQRKIASDQIESHYTDKLQLGTTSTYTEGL